MEELALLGGRTGTGQVGVHEDDRRADRLDELHKALQAAVTQPVVVMEGQHHVGTVLLTPACLRALVTGPVKEDIPRDDCKLIEG